MPASERPASPPVRSVVRVPFSYTGRPVLQRRPGLVVWAYEGTGRFAPAWVSMIPSAETRGRTWDVAISDLDRAGPPAPSLVRMAEIATVEADHVESSDTPVAGARAAVATALAGRLPA